jgi:glycerate dehydrogenase
MRAVLVAAGTFGKEGSADLLKSLPIQWNYYDQTTPAQIVERMRDAEIAVTNKAAFRKETIQALPRLKLICVIATGVDCVDLQAAKEAGITVCNVPDYSKGSVSQLTVLMILALANSFFSYVDSVKKGHWQRQPYFSFLDYPITEVRGKKLGIFGYGNLGKEVARIMTAFGMQILIVEGTKRSVPGALPLLEVLRQCDFFTIHTPLTPATRNAIGKKELDSMKKTAFLINAARGGIVDEEALAAALKAGRIAGAGFDVLTREPPPTDHPLLDPSIPNLLLTPHIAWASSEARQTLLEVTKSNIQAFLNGSVANQV